jgi:hypothetical protein
MTARSRLREAATTVLCAAGLAGATPGWAGQAATLSPLATIEGPAELVQIHNERLHVVADRTLRIFDIAKPSRPVPIGGFTFGERIISFAVSASRVYALADFHGVRILDISDPKSPALRGSFPLRGGHTTVALFDDTTLLVTGRASGLQIIDVSNADAPVRLAAEFTDGYAQSVSVSRPLAYVIDDPTGLYVFDLSKPQSPEAVGLLDVSVPPPQGAGAAAGLPSHGVAVAGPVAKRPTPIAAVIDKTGGLLLFYDVSNPAAPVRVGQHVVPVGAEALVLQESLAYLALGRQGLRIVDFSTPSKPIDAGSLVTKHPAVDVRVSDSLVCVATGPGGVQLLGRN